MKFRSLHSMLLAVSVVAVLFVAGCSRSKPAEQTQNSSTQTQTASSQAAPAPSQTAPPQNQAAQPPTPPAQSQAPLAQPAVAANSEPPAATPAPSAPPEVPQSQIPSVPAANVPPPSPAPVEVTIPEGRTFSVITHQTLSSAANSTGDSFEGSLAAPISVNGTIVLPKGAIVTGVVANAVPSGRLSTPAELAVRLKSVEAYGTTYKITSSMVARKGKSHKGRNTAIIGGSAVGGAIIGGLLGGGKGAGIGALAGGGGGAAGAAATGKSDITIAAETRLHFTLRHPLAVKLPASRAQSGAAAPSGTPQ